MGASVAVSLKAGGHRVHWASDGRGEDTRRRAEEHGLVDLGTLAKLCAECPVLVSVVPPHAAEEVAEAALEHWFDGVFLDANAIAPERSSQIGAQMAEAGATYVDGGIIGGPAWEPGTTRLYLSGEAAAQVAGLFAGGALVTRVLKGGIGKASGLKMAYAAYTKGSTALLAGVVSLASQLGVLEELEAEWAEWGDFAEETRRRLRRVTAKAWRFQGEMDEIAATFEAAGLPAGFHRAAAELYGRLAGFKGAEDSPSLMRILAALSSQSPTE
jgi:3-hydroxyisobutyrate dehydrogenase-like beta-hydroxyacid dehydrogenase